MSLAMCLMSNDKIFSTIKYSVYIYEIEKCFEPKMKSKTYLDEKLNSCILIVILFYLKNKDKFQVTHKEGEKLLNLIHLFNKTELGYSYIIVLYLQLILLVFK